MTLNDPRKLKLRIEVLDTDDVKFIQSMLAARIKEAQASKKLDPQERDMLVSRYRGIFNQLDRRFPKASGHGNPMLQIQASAPGHVLLIDERVTRQTVNRDDVPGILSGFPDKLITDCKIIGVLNDKTEIRFLKDRTGINMKGDE